MDNNEIRKLIIDVPNFPKPGVTFKDITPLIANPEAMEKIIDNISKRTSVINSNKIVAIEARGFLFGSLLSQKTGIPLILARKKGKLPREVKNWSYELEYGSDTIEIHADAIDSKDHVIIIDDILATGGTARAVGKLVEKEFEAYVEEFIFLMEIPGINGRQKLKDIAPLFCVLDMCYVEDIDITPESNAVHHPSHYGGAKNIYEAIKVIEAWGLGFCLGNTVKYLSRAGKKDKTKRLEDMEKAMWYLDREISQLKRNK